MHALVAKSSSSEQTLPPPCRWRLFTRQSMAPFERQLTGSGLFYCPVEHRGCQNICAAEVEAVRRICEVLTADHKWRDAEGTIRELRPSDILVVAPYNAQVAELRKTLTVSIRVGTVDRFQGQEAPVVIYSLTSSSIEDSPRGMEFLFSPNRLNVAVSRARCVSILVGCPELFAPDCSTPEQMRWANAFALLSEYSTTVRLETNQFRS